MIIEITDAATMAFKNKTKLPKECSCYHCLKSFKLEEIKEWTDQGKTALCPSCLIDSVIPKQESDLLAKIHNYWFGSK